MKALKNTVATVCCVVLLGGCYEDTAEVTLKSDGSGTVKMKFALSERVVVAASDTGAAGGQLPPITKQRVREDIGAALDISSLDQTDLPDGGTKIELEGTFTNPAQFFSSVFCQERLSLRLTAAPNGQAAIYCTAGRMSGESMGPGIAQVYGAAKGLYVKRTVHLPGDIGRTNGQKDGARTVSWVVDLRDRAGLAATKEYVEGPDKGRGFAFFDASQLGFTLPLRESSPSPAAEAAQGTSNAEPTGLQARLSWVSLKKKALIEGGEGPEISDLEIGVMLSWDQEHPPLACRPPVLLTLTDDGGKDLVPDASGSTMLRDIYASDKRQAGKELQVRARTPSAQARSVMNITGYIEVTTAVTIDKVALDDIKLLAGRQTTGNPILDKLNCKILAVKSSGIDIEIDGGNDTIQAFRLIDADGGEIGKRGHSGYGNRFTYQFNSDPAQTVRAELEVVTERQTVRVPFSSPRVPLP